MRGRTNITPRTIPKVNGNIEQYQVEAGYTVRTGDFVEIAYTQIYGNFNNLSNKKSVVIDNEYFIVCGYVVNEGLISLLRIVGNEVRSINSISLPIKSNVRYGLSKIGNSVFVTTENKIYNFKIESGSLVQKENITIDNQSTGNLCCSDGYNLFVVSNAKISVYTLSSDLLSLDDDYSYDDGYSNKTSISDCVIISGKLIISFVKPYAYIGCYNITYSSNSVTSISNINVLQITTTIDSNVYSRNLIVAGSKICMLANTNNSFSYIVLFGVYNAGIVDEYSFSENYNIIGWPSCINAISDDRIVIFSRDKVSCRVYKITTTNSIEFERQYENMISSTDTSNGAFPDLDVVIAGVIIHINYSSYNVLTLRNGVLNKGWGTESNAKVKPYSNGNAIGFAKIGGTSGQTIKVYVP